jgi:hypothetical protein
MGRERSEAPYAKIYGWVPRTAEALKTGAPWRGPVTREMVQTAPALMTLYQLEGEGLPLARLVAQGMQAEAGLPDAARAEALQAMARLKPSRQQLINTLALVTLLPDEAQVQAYLDRHDPGGGVANAYLGSLSILDPAKDCGVPPAQVGRGILFVGLCGKTSPEPAALRYAKRAVSSGKVQLASLGPDRRLSSPEQTWQLFVSSLRNADRASLALTLTPQGQAKLSWIQAAPDEKLREIGAAFKVFKVTLQTDRIAEAAIGVKGPEGKPDRGGFVQFLLQEGEWRIQEM